ncbi:hypothetical protein SOPP22_05390 [Shewanella sp. OPT22]|nr:hypothetical protein SOPP22_05390 [Shewanella sp. OPT22]
MATNFPPVDSYLVPQLEWNRYSYYQLMRHEGKILGAFDSNKKPVYFQVTLCDGSWQFKQFHEKPSEGYLLKSKHLLPNFESKTLEDVTAALNYIETAFKKVENTAKTKDQNTFIKFDTSLEPAMSCLNRKGQSVAHVSAEHLLEDTKYMAYWVTHLAKKDAPLSRPDNKGYTALDYLYSNGYKVAAREVLDEKVGAKLSTTYALEKGRFEKAIKQKDFDTLLRLLVAIQHLPDVQCINVIAELEKIVTPSLIVELLGNRNNEDERKLGSLILKRCHKAQFIRKLLNQLMVSKDNFAFELAIRAIPNESLKNLGRPSESLQQLLLKTSQLDFLEAYLRTGLLKLKDSNGKMIFELAVEQLNYSKINYLMGNGESLDAITDLQKDMLHTRIIKKYGAISKCLFSIFNERDPSTRSSFIKWLILNQANALANDKTFFELLFNGQHSELLYEVYCAVANAPNAFPKLFTDQFICFLYKERKYPNYLNYLVRQKVDCNVYLPHRNTMLIGAVCEDSNIGLFSRMIRNETLEYNLPDKAKRAVPPIIAAVTNHNWEIIEHFCSEEVSEKVDFSVTDHNGHTALILAAKNGDFDIVDLLSERMKSESIKKQDNAQKTAVSYIVSKTDSTRTGLQCRVLFNLLQRGAELETTNSNWKKCTLNMSKELRLAFAIYWCQNAEEDPQSILRSLVVGLSPEEVHSILHVLIDTWTGFMPVYFDLLMDTNRAVARLVNQTKGQTSLLHKAAAANNRFVCELLIEAGVTCDLVDAKRRKPLYLTLTSREVGAFEYLIEDSSSFDVFNQDELHQLQLKLITLVKEDDGEESEFTKLCEGRLELLAKKYKEKINVKTISQTRENGDEDLEVGAVAGSYEEGVESVRSEEDENELSSTPTLTEQPKDSTLESDHTEVNSCSSLGFESMASDEERLFNSEDSSVVQTDLVENEVTLDTTQKYIVDGIQNAEVSSTSDIVHSQQEDDFCDIPRASIEPPNLISKGSSIRPEPEEGKPASFDLPDLEHSFSISFKSTIQSTFMLSTSVDDSGMELEYKVGSELPDLEQSLSTSSKSTIKRTFMLPEAADSSGIELEEKNKSLFSKLL